MTRGHYFSVIIFLFVLAGCATSANKKNVRQAASAESAEEVSAALQSIVGAVSGQKVDEKKLRDLAQEMKKDKTTEAAVQSVTEALTGTNRVIKYCPVDGKRFGGKVETCPEHNVLLENLEE